MTDKFSQTPEGMKLIEETWLVKRLHTSDELPELMRLINQAYALGKKEGEQQNIAIKEISYSEGFKAGEEKGRQLEREEWIKLQDLAVKDAIRETRFDTIAKIENIIENTHIKVIKHFTLKDSAMMASEAFRVTMQEELAQLKKEVEEK